MLTVLLLFLKFLSGLFLLCAFISLFCNPWDFGGSSETPRAKNDDDDFDILYMDDDDDDD